MIDPTRYFVIVISHNKKTRRVDGPYSLVEADTRRDTVPLKPKDKAYVLRFEDLPPYQQKRLFMQGKV